jgi:DNA-binding XRE family transcriptional regulator
MRPAEKAEIALRFKKLRDHASMTQLGLSETLGICRQAVWEIEHERTLPHLKTWRLFAILEAKYLAEAGRMMPSGPWELFSQLTQKDDSKAT